MVPIPEGSESHSEESEFTTYGDSQEELDQPGPLTGSGGCHLTSQKANKAQGACEMHD